MSAPVVVGVDGGASGTDALVLGRWVAETLDEPLLVAVVHPDDDRGGRGRGHRESPGGVSGVSRARVGAPSVPVPVVRSLECL